MGPLLYIALLVCALVYVRNSFVEYLSGKTYYTMSQKPITVHDLPTVILCSSRFGEIPLKYGKSFRIQVSDRSDCVWDPTEPTCDGGFNLKVTKMSIGISTTKGEYTCRKLLSFPARGMSLFDGDLR